MGNPLHGSVSGSYNQKSKDSDTQAKEKFGNCEHKSQEGKGSWNQKINQPKDSGA